MLSRWGADPTTKRYLKMRQYALLGVVRRDMELMLRATSAKMKIVSYDAKPLKNSSSKISVLPFTMFADSVEWPLAAFITAECKGSHYDDCIERVFEYFGVLSDIAVRYDSMSAGDNGLRRSWICGLPTVVRVRVSRTLIEQGAYRRTLAKHGV